MIIDTLIIQTRSKINISLRKKDQANHQIHLHKFGKLMIKY